MHTQITNIKDILELCRQRKVKPLKQRKTVTVPSIYVKDYPYLFKVFCSHKKPILLSELEKANISFRPIGRAPDNDHGPREYIISNNTKRQGMKDWSVKRWRDSWGIQIFTGVPSEQSGAFWHDLEFSYEAICAAPDEVLNCIEALANAVMDPLLTLLKCGGLRFTCRIPNYLHPYSNRAKQYIYKETFESKGNYQRDVYLEIVGNKGFRIWDARYEILLGNLLDPPILTRDVLFAHIDTLKTILHEPIVLHGTETNRSAVSVLPNSLGSPNLDLAKDALVKRGFSYVFEENGLYYWKVPNGNNSLKQVCLWEEGGIVWIHSYIRNIGLPINSTPITEVWKDTGIVHPLYEKMSDAREGKISPLAIKRSKPILSQSELPIYVNTSSPAQPIQIPSIFDNGVRILGIIGENVEDNFLEIASGFLKNGEICLNVSTYQDAAEEMRHFQKTELNSIGVWKPRLFEWEKVKSIPYEIRIKNPFQHGNICEDPESCNELYTKGINPDDVYCPKCPVYTDCKERGYLSQMDSLKQSQMQIIPTLNLFVNPGYTEWVEELIKPSGKDEKLCILKIDSVFDLYYKCELSKDVIEKWHVDWEGDVLGNFAKALINVLEIDTISHSDAIKRVRATVMGFEYVQEEIMKQMNQVKIRCSITQDGINDPATGKELARYRIQFESNVFAYIPIDSNCVSALKDMQHPVTSLKNFEIGEDISISIPISEAIELGIFDTNSINTIKQIPPSSGNPDWTIWHQLIKFFSIYKENSDAPMRWNDEVIEFWLPPTLHNSVKRLLLFSTTLSDQHLRKVFPGHEIVTQKTMSKEWLNTNQIFQIRSGIFTKETLLNFDNNWNSYEMSKMAWNLFSAIRSEIEHDLNVKHAIITFNRLIKDLKEIIDKENLCFITHFEDLIYQQVNFAEPDVYWIVGTPYPTHHIVCRRAQMLYGNDKKRLNYDEGIGVGTYKDERIHDINVRHAVRKLKILMHRLQLHRSTNKKVLIISSLILPDITNRPGTQLFDLEDLEVSDGLDKLSEAIVTRQRYEVEKTHLNAQSSRDEVQRVLGCSVRQAYRVMRKIRGGPLHIPLRTQIFTILDTGEKKTAEITAAIEKNPTSVKNELKRLVDSGEIIKIRRGLYSLPSK